MISLSPLASWALILFLIAAVVVAVRVKYVADRRRWQALQGQARRPRPMSGAVKVVR